MAVDDLLGFTIEEEDGFDPFAEGDFAGVDDEPVEGVPVQEEVPECVRGRHGAYDAQRFDHPEEAIELLMKNNAGRRFVLLDIIEFCTNTRSSGEVEAFVDKRQQSNFSVYDAATLCRMLERSGALTVRRPIETTNALVEDDGVEYLEIKEVDEPAWTSTDAGLRVLAAHREGAAVRDLVLGKEPHYREIYCKLLAFLADGPRSKTQIDELLQDEPVLQVPPRRSPGHFVDMLEGREGIEWTCDGWALTEAGRRLWRELAG